MSFYFLKTPQKGAWGKMYTGICTPEYLCCPNENYNMVNQIYANIKKRFKNSHQLPIDLPSVNCLLPASQIALPTVLCIGYIPPPATCLQQGSENQGSWIKSRLLFPYSCKVKMVFIFLKGSKKSRGWGGQNITWYVKAYAIPMLEIINKGLLEER